MAEKIGCSWRKGYYLFLFAVMIVFLFVLVVPVSASFESELEQQDGIVCVWNGNTYSPGQYFYNTAGQQYLCYADGSYHFTGVTMIPSSYYASYPYSNCTTTCSAYSCYTTCSQSSVYYPSYTVYSPYYSYSPNVLTAYPYGYYYYYPTYY